MMEAIYLCSTWYLQVDSSLICLEELPSNQFNDNSEILRAARKSLSNYHGKVVYCLNELGLICAAEVLSLLVPYMSNSLLLVYWS